jgi:hypothetical protein
MILRNERDAREREDCAPGLQRKWTWPRAELPVGTTGTEAALSDGPGRVSPVLLRSIQEFLEFLQILPMRSPRIRMVGEIGRNAIQVGKTNRLHLALEATVDVPFGLPQSPLVRQQAEAKILAGGAAPIKATDPPKAVKIDLPKTTPLAPSGPKSPPPPPKKEPPPPIQSKKEPPSEKKPGGLS